jgi:hypothetical protein
MWVVLFSGRRGGSGGRGRAGSGVVREEKRPGVRDDKRAPLVRERGESWVAAGLVWFSGRPSGCLSFFCSGSFSFFVL